MQTATNPGARWLFPGRRAGQPLNAATLQQLIRELDIPSAATRVPLCQDLARQFGASGSQQGA